MALDGEPTARTNSYRYVRKEPSLFVPFEKVVLVDAYGCLYRRQVS